MFLGYCWGCGQTTDPARRLSSKTAGGMQQLMYSKNGSSMYGEKKKLHPRARLKRINEGLAKKKKKLLGG